MNNKEIFLGDIKTTRDFNFVLDTCEAFFQCFNTEKTIGDTFNACSGFEISIEDTVERIADLMGQSISIKQEEKRIRPQKSEVRRLVGTNKKLKEATGWEPSLDGLNSLLSGLKLTIEWIEKSKIYRKGNDYTI